MVRFFRRFIGALALDAGTFEDVEADRRADAQAAAVVALASIACGFAAMGLRAASPWGFAAGLVAMLGGWVVWAVLISAIGTTMMPEPQTRSGPRELLRTLGFAAAPGVFYGFAAMQAAAPFVFVVVSAWMIAAAVLAVRQALDYKSTGRAAAVCAIAWILSFGVTAGVGMLMSRPVS